ncbi:hypothetical protein N7448_011440 [Penicillium atrosanguineum]|nr:hypothetical protein N7448_011440 [Penicillium atrosanguineum]
MGLIELPAEILFAIVSYVSHQCDLYALVRTNRYLYKILSTSLYHFNGKFHHGAALPSAAEQNHCLQVQSLLAGLRVACGQPRVRPPLVAQVENGRNAEEEEEEEEEEDEMLPRRPDGRWDPTDPYWEDIFIHPFYQQGYSIASVVNIQHALSVAVRGAHSETVMLLLDFGAQVNFYRGCRVQSLLPQTTSKWWHSVPVDNPPLFTAVQFGHLELVKLLLDRGADAERYAPSPLYRAVEDNRHDIIPILLKSGVGPQATALKLAVLQGNESIVRLLLDGGLRVLECGHSGLYAAEMKGQHNIVNLLKSRGATIAALSDIDRTNWADKDGDGTIRPFHQRLFISYADEVEEEPDADDD